MDELIISAKQTPGVVTFDNYEELKAGLTQYVKETFDFVDYEQEGVDVAAADCKELKKKKDAITKVKKELKNAYSAPYEEVEKKLDELISILDVPYKKAKDYADTAEKKIKEKQIMEYARERASSLGDIGGKVVASQAFFNAKWLNKTASLKSIHQEIDTIVDSAATDINLIQSTGGDQIPVLMARYYETLSMDGVDSFLENLKEGSDEVDELAMASDKNVVGYKVLKITATEDQMAFIMSQLDLMGVEVEEIEDGMPKPMEEKTIPNFNSFVAFDIETTGTNGAANGDSEAQITEIGAVRVVNGQVVEKFDELANPGRKIVPRIARLTHITDEMVADKPPVSEVIRMFKEFAGDDVLVGHNIKSSDLRYILKAADKAGVNIDNAFLDTYILAKKFKKRKGWEKLNLGYLAGQYGFEHKEAHRAWSDAEVNAQVYFELQKMGNA